jgi:hypothetical protein
MQLTQILRQLIWCLLCCGGFIREKYYPTYTAFAASISLQSCLPFPSPQCQSNLNKLIIISWKILMQSYFMPFSYVVSDYLMFYLCCERVLLCVRRLLYRFVYDASAASSDASGRGPDEVNAAHPPFDSTSYTRRTKIVVRRAFPAVKTCTIANLISAMYNHSTNCLDVYKLD